MHAIQHCYDPNPVFSHALDPFRSVVTGRFRVRPGVEIDCELPLGYRR